MGTEFGDLRLNGAPAFRDLGGIVTADGRRIRPGELYRSEALLDLSDEDQAAVRNLKLRLVCDLRSESERSAHPCMPWLRPEPRVMALDLAAHLTPATAPFMERMRIAPGPDIALNVMMSTYNALPRACGEALGAIFQALLSGESPLLVHCSAGKDRTGFVSAMLLSALGVPRERVFEDYLHTGTDGYSARVARTAMVMALILQKPLDPESLATFSGVRRAYLEAAFTRLEAEWGSVDQYLADVADLDGRRRQLLQTLLLES